MPRRGSSKPPAEPVVKPYGCDFAVEERDKEESRRTGRKDVVTYSPETVKTGDPAKLMFWSIATLLSGLCLLICGVIYQKKSRGGEACD